MGLVEFLNARLDEDEQTARAADEDRRRSTGGFSQTSSGSAMGVFLSRWDPARVLAEVAAKRAIVERFAWLRDNGWSGEPELPVLEEVARALAQPYSDHPDFDPAWKLI